MTEEVEDKLLTLSKHILKVHKQLAFDNKYGTKGKVNNCMKYFFLVLSKNFWQIAGDSKQSFSVQLSRSQQLKLNQSIPINSRQRGIDDQSVANMNDEWKCMFGGPDSSSKLTHSSQNP